MHKDDPALEKAGAELRAVTAEVGSYWQALIECHELPIVQRPPPQAPLKWWLPALKLLIFADEASQDLGYQPVDAELSHPIENIIRGLLVEDENSVLPLPGNEAHLIHLKWANTFAPHVNPHLVRVVPKSRTPSVGCTLRVLSHNLAIVPPEGIVDVNWFREIRPFREDKEPLNLLLIPFPYEIAATAFAAISEFPSNEEKPADRVGRTRSGWFRIQQDWLHSGKFGENEFAEFVAELVQTAARDLGRIHGVILPELSLDWKCYSRLVEKIQQITDRKIADGSDDTVPFVEFIVAGISSDHDLRKGNYVATSTFSVPAKHKCVAATHMRSKHHRWKLAGEQITDYALGAALDPNISWWEANDLPRREISLTVFRRGAVFCPMICEDLARSEPCHESLRSVGPNLIFVLLMDGPQLPGRWAARYATSLADDPGSSVLTLTSLGLMERANGLGRHPASRHIALWKDDSGQTVQISCPQNAQAIAITLSGVPAEESTLDGRPNEEAQAWRYRGHQPVRLSPDLMKKSELAWIVKKTDSR
ncbi:MAG: hypothetical protein WCE79_16465 [Xanthobacteraceae bacterium]